jgi:hypothetical protein
MTVISFEEALRATEGEDRSLLLGNGFSVAQSEGAFAYKNLLDKSGVDANSPIRKVFSTLATVDFEEVIHALEHAAKVEEAYDDETKKNLFANDAQSVRNALISAIQAVHPKIVFEIPDKELHSCKSFLTHFSSIFTLNYDLLLYWVRLSPNSPSFSDGFGQGKIVDGFRKFSPSGNCSIYNLHGGLHLFTDNERNTLKKVAVTRPLLDEITTIINRQKILPLFVAEGTTSQKMFKINSVPYLKHCYDKLTTQSGNLFIFGHSAHENDSHIYDAIFDSPISKLFFCIFDPTKLRTIQEFLAKYSVRNPRISIQYVDASQMDIWGKKLPPATPRTTAGPLKVALPARRASNA